MDITDILKKIENLRHAKGWSVYKLAEECCMSPSTFANMQSRGTLPSVTTLYAVCSAFNISLAEFFADSAENAQAEAEKIMLADYRQLPDKTKDAVRRLIRDLSER